METQKYHIDIGLEVHVELATLTKMFCGCRIVDTSKVEPNSNVCPVCMGLPGALPVINQKAVEYGIRAGLALGCQLAETSIFARKNYFYPDLPKGYQISQYEQPLAQNGILPIKTQNGWGEVRIRRAHLEEDTGKLTHVKDGRDNFSLVDLNRCGVPLLEIVSEPDMHSVEEVRAYSFGLRRLLRYIEITSGDMEKGAMRFEANLSLRPAKDATLGTRVEIKNLNSFRAMERAILYQIQVQTADLQAGKKVKQQTLGWNETEGKTQPQRSKEEAEDYRYFPEPDLPPLLVDKKWVDRIRENLPEPPFIKIRRYCDDHHLPDQDAERLVEERITAAFYESCLKAAPQLSPKLIANWITGELFGWMNEHSVDFSAIKITPRMLIELITLLEDRQINAPTAKVILAEMLSSGLAAKEIVQQNGLEIISGTGPIQNAIQQVLADHPREIEQYLKGKESLSHWLFGQVMSAFKGKADPAVVRRLIEHALSQLKSKRN
jgi:aspartyl-tRNA(Asn)/glutamyl-tRNA(Gln) amidotransferase subunit B